MSSEAAFQRRVLRLLRAAGDAHKHVDAGAGVPDISFTLPRGTKSIYPSDGQSLSGWIELKEGRGEWLFKEQALWVRRRGRAGAACFMMRLEGRQVGLWWWETALKRGAPDARWDRYPTAAELAQALREVAQIPQN